MQRVTQAEAQLQAFIENTGILDPEQEILIRKQAFDDATAEEADCTTLDDLLPAQRPHPIALRSHHRKFQAVAIY